MKYILGIIGIILVSVFATVFIMLLWGIPVPWLPLFQIGGTLLVVCLAALLFYLLYHWFFKKEKPERVIGKKKD